MALRELLVSGQYCQFSEKQIGLVKEEVINNLSTSIYTDVNELKIVRVPLMPNFSFIFVLLGGHDAIMNFNRHTQTTYTLKHKSYIFVLIFCISTIRYIESAIISDQNISITFCFACKHVLKMLLVKKWTHLHPWTQEHLIILILWNTINGKENSHGKVATCVKSFNKCVCASK